MPHLVMKHFTLLMCMCMAGAILGLASPFWPLLLYYIIAVLQPAVMWSWSLQGWPEVRWGAVSATILIVSCLIHGKGLLRDLKLNPILALCAVFGAWVTISALSAFSVDTASAWGYELAKILIVVALGSVIVRRVWQVRLLTLAAAACVAYVALSIHRQYFFEGGRLDVYHQGLLNLDNNGVGLVLVIALPLAYYAAFHRATMSPQASLALRAAGFAGFGLILHAVMMTYSRGSMIAAALACAWLVWCHRPRRHALGLGVLGVAVILSLAGPDIRERAASSFEVDVDSSAQSRLSSWEAAWDMTWDNPMLGAGMRNSVKFSHNFGADLPGRVVHNQYLQVAADSGLPAAAIYVAMVGLSWMRLNGCRRTAVRAGEEARRLGDERAEARAQDAERLCLALSASIIALASSAMFLSIEIIELPWMLIMIAGVAPAAVMNRLSDTDETLPEASHEPEPAYAPGGAMPAAAIGPALPGLVRPATATAPHPTRRPR